MDCACVEASFSGDIMGLLRSAHVTFFLPVVYLAASCQDHVNTIVKMRFRRCIDGHTGWAKN